MRRVKVLAMLLLLAGVVGYVGLSAGSSSAGGQKALDQFGWRRLSLSGAGGNSLGLQVGEDTPTPATGGGTIRIGQTVDGYLERGAEDTWTFEGEFGQIVTIQMVSDEMDTYLELYGPDGALLIEDNDSGVGLNSLIEGYVLPQTGTYTIIARSFGYVGEGRYSLSLQRAAQARPTNSPTPTITPSPTPLPPGGGTIELGQQVTGYIQGQQDSWTFQGQAGTVITISMEANDDNRLDTYLELYDPDGIMVAWDDDSGIGLNSLIRGVELPVTGQYTIIARGFSQTSFGGYNLRLVPGDVWPTPIGGEGGTIECGGIAEGSLRSPGQVDTWMLDVPSSSDLLIVDFTSNVVEGEGDILFSVEHEGAPIFGYWGGEWERPPISIPIAEPGLYMFVVYATTSDTTGSYTLRVDCSEATPTPSPTPLPTPVDVGTISFGQSVRGELGVGERQVWHFTGEAGQVISISLFADDWTDTDTYLELLGPDGERIAEDDDGGPALNSLIRGVSLPTDGDYTILVRTFNDAGDGGYELTLAEGDEFPVPPDAHMGALEPGMPVTLSVDGPGFWIWEFRIERPSLASLDVQFKGDYEGSFNLLQSGILDDGGADLRWGGPSIEEYELPSGHYWLALYVADGIGDVELPISVVLTLSVTDAPPTPTPGLGGAIHAGEAVTGHLETGSFQIWTYEGRQGEIIDVSMSSDDFDTYLVVYGPDGEEIASDDDSGQGLNSLINGLVLPQSGTYTIEARSFRDGGSGDYVLTLTTLGVGELWNGHLEPGSSQTWTYEGRLGEALTISMNSGDFDTYLVVYGPDGREIAHDDDSGYGLNSLISGLVLPQSGTYTIEARSFNDAGSGEYVIALVASEAPGQIVPTETPSASGTGPETATEGDQAAQPIQIGQTVHGELEPNASQVWSFYGTNQIVSISVFADDWNALDPYVELHGPDGELLLSDDDSGMGLNALIRGYQLPGEGNYTIVVGANGGTWGGYELTLATLDEWNTIPMPEGHYMGILEPGTPITVTLEPSSFWAWLVHMEHTGPMSLTVQSGLPATGVVRSLVFDEFGGREVVIGEPTFEDIPAFGQEGVWLVVYTSDQVPAGTPFTFTFDVDLSAFYGQ